MLRNLQGYEISAPIYESSNSTVYRGIQVKENRAVILKTLKQDYPTLQERIRYKQEYEIVCSLDLEGVVRAYDFQEHQRNFVIIFEDFGGISLKELINPSSTESRVLLLNDFFPIAIKIAEILGQIHSHHIIHKDINPANIIFNPQTQNLKIIDFGIASQLTREHPTLKNPNVLEGTLAYISPEQTGRMNRSLDYRTDFYSLGIAFYELLTGKLPFPTTAPLELVHCHIAKQPPPLEQFKIPKALSAIVMKLMAKAAEDRYQSTWGIVADLQECWQQLQAKGAIADFPLATQDISDKFQIPQKLYGREGEVATLLDAFEQIAGRGQRIESSVGNPSLEVGDWETDRLSVSNGEAEETTFNSELRTQNSKLFLVAGYSGIGKSALVQEVHKPMTEARGYFISGKFDQFQRNIPYSAIVSAFQDLVRQLLTEGEEQLNQWRGKLLSALESNGQAIVDVIPEVELIIGKQPAIVELGATETQNRFNRVFGNFVRVFCSREHPLIIFLDDLQWVDSASLKLIELMMSDREIQSLFFIGAYRDNEVDSTHPLMMALNTLEQQGVASDRITLTPLTLEHISHLIADTLQCNREFVQPLAELVERKTSGNPFFVNEFLKTLYAENLIYFDTALDEGKQRGWRWDIDRIRSQNITDNVVELMIERLKQLPESTQEVLCLAACVGAKFNLNTLSIICEEAAPNIFQSLRPAIQSGLILSLSELDDELLIQDYKFRHDRIQQAAYALIDEAQKTAVHLKIGRLLLQNTVSEELSEKIFEIVDHCNLGIPLVTEQQERDTIAQLNLFAAQKAKAATAYVAASEYLHTGRQLLSAESWEKRYDLTLALYQEATEAAYLSGDFQQMEELAEIVQDRAKTVLEQIKIYDVKIQAFVSQKDLKGAIQIALSVLRQLGVILPEQPNEIDIQQALEDTAALLTGRNIEDLIDLPEMTDPEKLAAMHIMASIAAAAYISSQELFVVKTALEVRLSIQYGNTALSAFSYVCYGVVLCGAVKDIESGYQFGKLAVNLLERFNVKEVKPKVLEVWGAHVLHWKEHFRESVPVVTQGYQVSLEVGDFEFAGYCGVYACDHAYFAGDELTALEEKIATYSKSIAQIRREIALNWATIFLQAVQNLLGKVENPTCLVGEAYNEEISLPAAIAAKDRTGIHLAYLNKLILCYLFGEKQQAVENAKLARPYIDGVESMIVEAPFYFYDSLAHLGGFTEASESEREAIRDRVTANQEKLKQWATHAPMNHQHKFHLVEAEKARVLGEIVAAMEHYEQAIAGARENQFIQEEALAYELAAEFYLTRSMEKFAQSYFQEAHYAYTRWGATAKTKDLAEKYPQFIATSFSTTYRESAPNLSARTSTSSQSGTALDLAAVMKAAQVISSEIVLDKLLASLMKILIQNAGAQIGYLLLPSQGKLFIEAEGVADTQKVSVLQSLPIEDRLPSSIINYVARTSESVVLGNATQEGNFTQDSYIQTKQSQSILCFPLVNQGKLVSIIYLENNLTMGAFTPERVDILKILSSQAAISIENARLYQTLEDRVKERTAQLAEANAEITLLNERLQEENLRMGAELDVAKQLQQMVLPKPEELQAIEGLDIAGFMQPADEVGGDYYDVLKQDNGVKIAIGDVTGHGLESGVLMIMAQTAVRTLQKSGQTDPVKFLDVLNQTLYDNLQRLDARKEMTLAVLDYAEGTLSLSGQHEELILVRREGSVECIETMNLGFPLGLDSEIADFISQERIHLNPGDVVVLYTDGIPEAEDSERNFYGLERLCDVVRDNRHLTAEEIRHAAIEDVRRHIGDQKVFDDITLVVLKQK